MTTQHIMGIFLLLSVAFNTVFAASYKIAARGKCNLHAVNVWMYVGSLLTMAAYILVKHSLLANMTALWLGVLAGMLAFFATMTFFLHITKGQLSASWTVISLSVAFPVLASIFAWKEIPSPGQIVGLALIVVALVLFGHHESGNGSRGEREKDRRVAGMSFILLMVAFVLTGFISILNKALVQMNLGDFRDMYLLGYFGAPTIAGVLLLLAKRDGGDKTDKRVGLVMGMGGALSTVFFLIALQRLPGIVAFPVRSLGNLIVTAIVSIIAWREELSRSQWLGIVLSLVAIWLIY